MMNVKEKYPFLFLSYGSAFDDSLDEKSQEKEMELAHAYREKYECLLRSRADLLAKGLIYLDHALCDCEVSHLKYDGKDFSFHAYDVPSIDFFDEIGRLLGMEIPLESWDFPVDLSFKNVTSLTLWKERGHQFVPLHDVSWSMPVKAEFWGDEIIALDEHQIEMGIMLQLRPSHRDLLLEVKAERLEIADNPKASFLKAFDPKFLPLFEKYWERRSKRDWFPLYEDKASFIKEALPNLEPS